LAPVLAFLTAVVACGCAAAVLAVVGVLVAVFSIDMINGLKS
jgi:hypothetical protein